MSSLCAGETTETSFFHTPEKVTFLARETSYRQIFEVPEYRLEGIRTGDHVIDIGANVGAFCIRASSFSQHVVAVEPVTASLLKENIRRNNVSVQVIEGALGNGKPATVVWDDTKVVTPTYQLRDLISMAGGCDFLKSDCEGAEWLIDPEDLNSIRHIEMELHLPPISGLPSISLLDYISSHYDFEIERKPVHATLGVLGILHAERND